MTSTQVLFCFVLFFLLESLHPGIVNRGHVKTLKSHLALLKSLKQCYSKDGSKLMPICKSFISGSDAVSNRIESVQNFFFSNLTLLLHSTCNQWGYVYESLLFYFSRNFYLFFKSHNLQQIGDLKKKKLVHQFEKHCLRWNSCEVGRVYDGFQCPPFLECALNLVTCF